MISESAYDEVLEQRWLDDGGRCPPEPEASDSSVNSKCQVSPLITARPVYPALIDHQRAENGWVFHDLAVLAHEWWDRFNSEFELETGQTALRFEWNLNRNCLGYFNCRHNEFGLIHEVALIVRPHLTISDDDELFAEAGELSAKVMKYLDRAEFIGSLLHEQLHLHQQLHGVPSQGNYHNRQYQKKAESLGLIVTPQGYQGYAETGPFQELLAAHNIQPPPQLPEGQKPAKKTKPKGTSKYKKWVCGCKPQFGVRVAIAEFSAQCHRCGRDFQRA